MDMIYTNSNLIDQGILQDYSFDMEYGIGEKDTNTFECKIQKYNPAMQGENRIDQDSVLYIEFTEYGGIIDRIESETNTGVITLSGRTWHGILNSFVIEPPKGLIYRTYNGTVTEVLTQMISDVGLDDLFEVDSEENEEDIEINNFEVRYESLYDAIIRMLNSNDIEGKLVCSYFNGKVHLVGTTAANYSAMEEFDSSQVPFKVGITYNNINHMVCLGQGNGEKRAVIHLFADEYGNIQPYTTTDEPLQDSDYILDKSQQVMTGLGERAYIYDYPNAEIVYNYIALTEKPVNWEADYYKLYYEHTGEDSSGNEVYEILEREFKNRFHLLTYEPADWRVNEGYKNYYTCDSTGTTGTSVKELQESDPECQITYTPTGGKNGQFWDWTTNWKEYYEYNSVEGTYSQVSSKYNEQWVQQTTQPPTWGWQYSSYSVRTWNGYTWVYSAVQGISQSHYEKQTKKPTDWNTNYNSYYTKFSKAKTIKDSNGKVTKTYKKGSYVKIDVALAQGWISPTSKKKPYPKWSSRTFYTFVQDTPLAPSFPPKGYNSVWYLVRTETYPDWQDGRYYERIVDKTPKFKLPDPANDFYGYWELHKNEEQIPDFVVGTYYYQVEDRYRILVSDALAKFETLTDTSTLDIDLELESNYDVGDIVGSIDEVTGIQVNKPILRKIIKIKKDIVSISYEVE